MARNSFIRMSKLPNLRGRIAYITSTVKQENLYATYSTCDDSFWRELAHFNQLDFAKSGTSGKCIEARELIIALPKSYTQLDPNELLKDFTDVFKIKYGVECSSALHHNKTKTNYHIHLIFSERRLLDRPIEKIATRNMYFDENGRHVRTKKEVIDEHGELRAGCRIVPKGEVYERRIFDSKLPLFKEKSFLEEIKREYTELINYGIEDTKEKLRVFEHDGIHLPTKKIGIHNPREQEIKENNQAVKGWNNMIDRISETVPKGSIRDVKGLEIEDRIYNSKKGNARTTYAKVLREATETIRNFANYCLRFDVPERMSDMFFRMLKRSIFRTPEKSRERDMER